MMMALTESSSPNFFSCPRPLSWGRNNHALKVDNTDFARQSRGSDVLRLPRAVRLYQREYGQHEEEKCSSPNHYPQQSARTAIFTHTVRGSLAPESAGVPPGPLYGVITLRALGATAKFPPVSRKHILRRQNIQRILVSMRDYIRHGKSQPGLTRPRWRPNKQWEKRQN